MNHLPEPKEPWITGDRLMLLGLALIFLLIIAPAVGWAIAFALSGQ